MPRFFLTVTGCISNSPPCGEQRHRDGEFRRETFFNRRAWPMTSIRMAIPSRSSVTANRFYGSVSQSGSQLIYYAPFAYCGPDGFKLHD